MARAMTATRQALPLAVAVLALAGCGRAGDRASVRSVTESFYAAARAHDGTRACRWLSAGARQALEQDQSSSCAQAVDHLKLSGGATRRVEIYSTNADVALSGGDIVYLETTPQGWRISAAGCRNPAYATPATCQVQS
jgi:hypothetical protein